MASSRDTVTWNMNARVLQYEPGTIANLIDRLGHEPTGLELRYLEEHHGLVPDDIVSAGSNQLTTAGLTRLTNLIVGGGGTAFTATRATIGVGDGSTAFTVGDTDLSATAGSTHRWFQGADSAPTGTGAVIAANATFASGDGNFVWNEWCWAIATATPVASAVFNTATTTGIMLNRKVQSMGTKVVGAVWTLQGTVTLS